MLNYYQIVFLVISTVQWVPTLGEKQALRYTEKQTRFNSQSVHLCSELEKSCFAITKGVYRVVSEYGPVKTIIQLLKLEGYSKSRNGEAGFLKSDQTSP